MPDQPTCGQGLAENSVLPRRLGEVIAAMAQVLEVHTEALDPEDADARRERDVYVKLAAEQRDAAGRLRAIAAEMAGQRELPMGAHDMAAMTSPKAADAFEAFIAAEEELLTLLEGGVRTDRAMLDQMRAGAP